MTDSKRCMENLRFLMLSSSSWTKRRISSVKRRCVRLISLIITPLILFEFSNVLAGS
ncbi:hypothetical protein IC582_019950 [Cucumis melo]